MNLRIDAWCPAIAGEFPSKLNLDHQFTILAGLKRSHGNGYFGRVRSQLRPVLLQHDQQGDAASHKRLLIPDVLVRRNQHIETGGFGFLDQIAVFKILPAQFGSESNLMKGKLNAQRGGNTVIEENLHRAAGKTGTFSGNRECTAAKVRTALTREASTPGNHSTNSCKVAPLARFSNSELIGSRVPLNTHAPLSLPGTLSTAEHCDQSIILQNYHRRGAFLNFKLQL